MPTPQDGIIYFLEIPYQTGDPGTNICVPSQLSTNRQNFAVQT
ncbi:MULTISPECIES: hypothetical protein [unclassified Nostoc]|nr:hypothetical protein [Nostoc sp. S13]MDF5735589.1 hypothetical protein [Nostoc sp. S13]